MVLRPVVRTSGRGRTARPVVRTSGRGRTARPVVRTSGRPVVPTSGRGRTARPVVRTSGRGRTARPDVWATSGADVWAREDCTASGADVWAREDCTAGGADVWQREASGDPRCCSSSKIANAIDSKSTTPSKLLVQRVTVCSVGGGELVRE